MKFPIAATAAAFCLIVGNSDADSVSIFASKDNTIYSDDLSNGAGDHIFAGMNGSGGGNQTLRGLIAFDIAANIPAGATIDSATLSLFATTPLEFGNHFVSIHRLLGDWGEGTSAAPMGEGGGTTPSAGDASWLRGFFGNPGSVWTTPGGDFVSTASATTLVLDMGFDYQWAGALVTADVQFWLDNPSGDFGWLLKGEETKIAKRFSSRTGSEFPVLEVEFTPIPEPAGSALAGLTLLVLTFRRRR